jgi:hypothetical protein
MSRPTVPVTPVSYQMSRCLASSPEPKREHREVRPAKPESQPADDQSHRGRRARAGQHGERPGQPAHHQRGRVGPRPEEGSSGERQVTRRPREERPRHGERHVGEDREQERAVIGTERERRRDKGHPHRRRPEPGRASAGVPSQRFAARGAGEAEGFGAEGRLPGAIEGLMRCATSPPPSPEKAEGDSDRTWGRGL